MLFTFLTQPIINFLTAVHGFFPALDLGLAIILLTVIIKAILFPLNWKSIKAQKKMNDIQKKSNEIKARITDKNEQTMEIMKLYKQEKVNPLSSCLPLILQLFVLIGLITALNGYMIEKIKINGQMVPLENALYKDVSFIKPENVKLEKKAFGFLDLTQKAIDKNNTSKNHLASAIGVIFAIISGLLQYVQTKMMTPKTVKSAIKSKEDELASAMNKQMLYMFPALTIWLGLSFPMGLTLYWIISSVLSILQQYIILNSTKKTAETSSNIIDIQKN